MPYIPYTSGKCPFRDMESISGLKYRCGNREASCFGGDCPDGGFREGCPYRDSGVVGKGFRFVTQYGQPK